MDVTDQTQGAIALAPHAAQEAISAPHATNSTPDIMTGPQVVPFRPRPLEAIPPPGTASGDVGLDERLPAACFRTIFETAAIGMSICQLDGRIVEANSALAGLLGYEREELTGIDPWRLDVEFAGHNTGEGPIGRIPLSEPANGRQENNTIEKLCQRRDGSEFWGRMTISLLRDEMARGDPQNEPAFLVVLLEDASARRQMEERLRQAEKMEVIGRLAGGVAHDFNNLLTGILLYSDLLLAELPPGSPLYRYVQEVQLACEQGAALTKQLLAVARKQGSEARAIEINDVVARIENFLRRMIGEQIELIMALDPAAGTLVGDAAQLRQILLNLVLNARDALGRGKVLDGKIRVSTRIAEWPQSLLDRKARLSTQPAEKKPAPPELRGGAHTNDSRRHDPDDRQRLAILLTVEDNGCGMSADTRAHLFEPLFTTKKAGEGTGLGLGTVQRVLGELGGAIEVTSAPGSGTRVEVFMPAAGPPGASESMPAGTTVPAGTEGQASAATDSQFLNRVANTPK